MTTAMPRRPYPDDTVIMPIKAVQWRFSGNRDISNILVAVDDQYETATVQGANRRLRHGWTVRPPHWLLLSGGCGPEATDCVHSLAERKYSA